MKKSFLMAVAVASLMLTSCNTGNTTLDQLGNSVLTDVLTGGQTSTTSATTTGNAVNTVLQSVLGITGTKVSQQALIGTWKYNQPGCAFTSENLLAQAGGEAVATSIKQKLGTYFQTAGIS